jgi:hypothetical protein
MAVADEGLKSLAELFLAARGNLRNIVASASGVPDSNAIEQHFTSLDTAYVIQAACGPTERRIASAVLAASSRAVLWGTKALASDTRDAASAASETATAPPVLPAVIASLTLGLVASVLAGLNSLALILALMVGALGYGAATGQVARLANSWPLSVLFVAKASRIELEKVAEKHRAVRETALSGLFGDIESALRSTDAAIAMMRQDAESQFNTPQRVQRERTEAPFLQDLAEAAAAGDAAHALVLAQRRLAPLAQSLGLTLVDASDATITHFTVEAASGQPSSGPLQTMRPAVLDGTTCIARGYARRTV